MTNKKPIVKRVSEDEYYIYLNRVEIGCIFNYGGMFYAENDLASWECETFGEALGILLDNVD